MKFIWFQCSFNTFQLPIINLVLLFTIYQLQPIDSQISNIDYELLNTNFQVSVINDQFSMIIKYQK